MMVHYYYMHWHEDDSLGVGCAADDPALDRLLSEPRAIVGWQQIDFILRDGTFADYQANTLGLRLCSETLRNILDENRAQGDSIQWLPCTVADHSGEKRRYFVLHVPTAHSVLDRLPRDYFVRRQTAFNECDGCSSRRFAGA